MVCAKRCLIRLCSCQRAIKYVTPAIIFGLNGVSTRTLLQVEVGPFDPKREHTAILDGRWGHDGLSFTVTGTLSPFIIPYRDQSV